MLAYHLEVSDESVAQKILNFIATMPKESVSVSSSKPSLSEEIERRVKEVQEGKVELIPFDEGFDEITDRLKSKYVNS